MMTSHRSGFLFFTRKIARLLYVKQILRPLGRTIVARGFSARLIHESQHHMV
jgi:hypothetical protein